MSDHAYLPPSGASEWVACASWPQMTLDHPDLGDKRASEQGTKVHAALAEILSGQPVSVELDDEEAECLDTAVEYVRSIEINGDWHIEEQVRSKVIHASQNWGTPDLYAWHGMHLHIADYKHGFGYVDHVRNLQLINYALMILANIEVDGLVEQSITVSLHIIQPRAYGHAPCRAWTVPATDLRAFANILRAAAVAATRLDRTATTGPQCTYCNGRTKCKAFRTVAGRAMDLSETSVEVDLDAGGAGVMLGMVRQARERLAAMETGLEEQVKHHLGAGRQVAGWAIERGAGRQKWSIPIEQVLAFGQGMGVNLAKPGVLTPTQARKAGLPDEVLGMFTETPSGAAKLVPANNSLASAVFSK